jgi:hypothetical protein
VLPGKREYGRAEIRVTETDDLFDGFEPDESVTVWASHGDHVDEPPPGFEVLASTRDLPVAAFRKRADADLRRAVPPGGRAHAARRRDPVELHVPHLRLRADVDGRLVHRRQHIERSVSRSATRT